ncbi:hypothetical protein BT69DRAFT_1295951 [Atractiella rhizophila]|nr:hypothetical protein BT69DRAFT_1295951 [Atractiella rhizophila]
MQVLSFLDIPDLHILSSASKHFYFLSRDIALHKRRITIVTPYILAHWAPSRPTPLDIIRRGGPIKGLELERRWCIEGGYIYSLSSQRQYNASLRLRTSLLKRTLKHHLATRPKSSNIPPSILPDENKRVAMRLLPALVSLKKERGKDETKRGLRGLKRVEEVWKGGMAGWDDKNERVRLAIVPGVRKFVRFFEDLSKAGKN